MSLTYLKYETGVATIIQFITLGLLNIANGANSVITTCRRDDTDCFSNFLVSVVFFLLVMFWFAFICLLGYLTQERRRKRFALSLIAAEGMVVLVATFNVKHNNDFLSFATSLIDLILALWIISLAFRVMRAGGQRITKTRQRPRQRVRH